MFAVRHAVDSKGNLLIQDPPIAQFLFQSTKASVIWLVLRLWMSYEWLEAGWHKFTDPAWMVDGTGILGFWTRALGNSPNGKPVITYDWYRTFIQFLVDSNSSVWFAKVVTFGELAIGLGLLLGAFVGIAACFGALMSMSFLMAGTVSTNPVLFFAGILLILAWKNAGYLGLDRILLPALGTPWTRPTLEAPTVRTPAVTPVLDQRSAPTRMLGRPLQRRPTMGTPSTAALRSLCDTEVTVSTSDEDIRGRRYLTAGDQYGHDHRHVLDGLPDPEHPEPRQRGRAAEAG